VKIALLTLVLAATVACQSTQTVSGERMETAGDDVWAEEVDIRLDERFIADSRQLEIQPRQIGVNQATFFVRVGGITQDVELHTSGPLSARSITPYRFELLSTSMEPSARLRISRLR
jgi:hypothetical protein